MRYLVISDIHANRQALDAVLAGKPVPTERSEAVGCYIPLNDAKH